MQVLLHGESGVEVRAFSFYFFSYSIAHGVFELADELELAALRRRDMVSGRC